MYRTLLRPKISLKIYVFKFNTIKYSKSIEWHAHIIIPYNILNEERNQTLSEKKDDKDEKMNAKEIQEEENDKIEHYSRL